MDIEKQIKIDCCIYSNLDEVLGVNLSSSSEFGSRMSDWRNEVNDDEADEADDNEVTQKRSSKLPRHPWG